MSGFVGGALLGAALAPAGRRLLVQQWSVVVLAGSRRK
jgi:hypothetical protein